jgi:hypothetical protein
MAAPISRQKQRLAAFRLLFKEPLVSVSTLCVIGVGVYGLTALSRRCAADEEQRAYTTTGAVDFVVVIDESLRAGGMVGALSKSRPTKPILVPCKDVFIYLDPKNAQVVQAWKSGFRRRPPREITFEATGDTIQPVASISQVGDRISRCAGDVPLWFVPIMNSPSGGLPKAGETFQFKQPERLPIEVSDPVRRRHSAWLLVVDHDVAAITNDEGVASFTKMPIGPQVVMRLSIPWLNEDVRMESSTLDIGKGFRFVLTIAEGAPQRHEIRVLPRD